MKNIGIYLEQRPEIFQNDLMANVAYTLGQRRSLMQWRVAISSETSFDLIQKINAGKLAPVRETDPPRIGFIFTGQGAQWHAMGKELYEQYPLFAASMDACDKFLESFGAPFSLVAELNKSAAETLVNEAHISQPACTAVQIAIVDLLRAWGVWPHAVTGHSSGEIGAAYAAGILPMDACMAISYHRGMGIIELKKKFPDLQGGMMAVGCTKEEIAPIIAGLKNKEVRVACFNSPSSLTISGDLAAIDELQTVMEEQGLFNRKLAVDVAYHSHHMKLIAETYKDALSWIDQPKPTYVKFYSSLVGHLVEPKACQPQYWVDNLTQAVRFSEALTQMVEPSNGHKTGVNMLVEIGPHSALAGPVKQILKAAGANAMKIPYASALIRKKDAVESALDLASALFVRGVALNFGAVNFPKPGKPPALLVDMPRYPWNHATKYWHDSRIQIKQKTRKVRRNDIIGVVANYSNDMEPTWRNIVRTDDLPWLRHHKIQGLTLFPMSGFVSMAIEAASQLAIQKDVQFDKFDIRNITVSQPLMITDEDIEMTINLRPYQEGTLSSSDSWNEFRIHSWVANKGWTEHCKGLIAVKSNDSNDVDGARLAEEATATLKSDIAEITRVGSTAVDHNKMYDTLNEIGVTYGPTFQGISNCQASESYSHATITVANTIAEMPKEYQSDMVIHPTFLEHLIEMYWPILGAGRTSVDTVYLPSSIGRIVLSKDIEEISKTAGNSLRAFCKGRAPETHPKPIQVSMFATKADDSTEAIIIMENLTIAPVIETIASIDDAHRELCYKLDWEPILEPIEVAVNGTNGHVNGNGVAESNSTSNYPTDEIIIVHGESESQKTLASKLASDIEHASGKTPVVGLLTEVETKEKLCIFLSELDKPLLSAITPEEFLALQKILTSVSGAMWVVRGAYVDSDNPDSNMITGLSRSIRSETLLKFATLDLDNKDKLSETSTVDAILKVFTATFGPKAEAGCELEFMERKGAFLTPRIINDAEMNEYVHKQTSTAVLESTPFSSEGRPLKMVIGTPGALDTLHFVDDTSVEEPLTEDEIEIEVKAIGMNPRDVMAALGHLSDYEFGAECSGTVAKIGSGVTSFQVGDHVAGISIAQGVYATFTRTKAALSLKLNKEISFEAAASIPVAYCTAHYALLDLARLESEESVLIHSAASMAGQAAISLAQLAGADVFVTVANSEEKALIVKEYGLPENRIFSSKNASFGPAIRSATNKRGIDVVLNSLASDADTMRETWDCLSNFGRFVEIGKRDASTRLETSRLESNTSFMSVDIMAIASERPKVMKRLVADVAKLLGNGQIKPVGPITVFPISDVETAFKVCQSGATAGKLVVVPQPEDQVKATQSNKQNKLLKPDATYILIGGTGGLGRTFARWMVGKGARNIVLVSRSGSETGKVKELIDEMAEVGAKIFVRSCDVADKASVDDLIANKLEGLPPVRGLVHGSMVLRVSFSHISRI